MSPADVGSTPPRPPAGELAPLMLTAEHRVAPAVRRHVASELRCPRGHLLAVTLGTATYGRWAAWRAPWVEHTPGGGWEHEWPEDAGWQTVTCTCNNRSWQLDVGWLAGQHGTLSTADLPTDTVTDDDPRSSTDSGDSPFGPSL